MAEIADTLQFLANAGGYGKNLRVIARRALNASCSSRRCTSRYFRNFESVIRELAARGHHVHLTADEAEAVGGGQELASALAAEYPGVTWDLLPSLERRSRGSTRRSRLRLGLDYARALEPRYAIGAEAEAARAERTPRVVRWAAAVPLVGPPAAARAR